MSEIYPEIREFSAIYREFGGTPHDIMPIIVIFIVLKQRHNEKGI
jgi:hypothetical protein